ncbi:MT-A70 family [Aspergillus lucknowensis]|uniref:MT-A70-domain-containing protein n=1 Tax=Aspergillus lucknowensis TaxID=176173 RepID=A0ABR4LPF5_9EURO
MTPNSSILYQNRDATVFLIDIPASIALAQELSPQSSSDAVSGHTSISAHASSGVRTNRRHLLSSPPLKTPYPPSSEPKTAAAREKVLERIPRSERDFAKVIEPLVSDALSEIRIQCRPASDWCLPRCSIEESSEGTKHEGGISTDGTGARLGKRRREESLRAYDQERQLIYEDFDVHITEQVSNIAMQPPLILSPGLNSFEVKGELCNISVRNTSPEIATVEIRSLDPTDEPSCDAEKQGRSPRFIIPPLSNFLLCNLPISTPPTGPRNANPIPGLPREQNFNLILLDPPWSNRSVRRSGHYHTQSYLDSGRLTKYICEILRVYSYLPMGKDATLEATNTPNYSIAAVWVTNSAKSRKTAHDSLMGAGFSISEEWVWIKTTTDGEPVAPIGGLWRKPYEALVIGKKYPASGAPATGILRRIIAAVPDIHSRKPNLREVFERVFFSSHSGTGVLKYSALEVFARNLTAGWWACGNEVLKFNSERWWAEG